MRIRHAFGKLRSRATARPVAFDPALLWPRDWVAAHQGPEPRVRP